MVVCCPPRRSFSKHGYRKSVSESNTSEGASKNAPQPSQSPWTPTPFVRENLKLTQTALVPTFVLLTRQTPAKEETAAEKSERLKPLTTAFGVFEKKFTVDLGLAKAAEEED